MPDIGPLRPTEQPQRPRQEIMGSADSAQRRRLTNVPKGEFAATQKNGPVLGVLLTLSARTNHFVADIR